MSMFHTTLQIGFIFLFFDFYITLLFMYVQYISTFACLNLDQSTCCPSSSQETMVSLVLAFLCSFSSHFTSQRVQPSAPFSMCVCVRPSEGACVCFMRTCQPESLMSPLVCVYVRTCRKYPYLWLP